MKKILIVDDEQDILETIVESIYIEYNDTEVSIDKALNGVEALKLVEQNPDYDLVVTDIRMPQMDGIELSRILTEKYPNIPVVVFSGHGDKKENDILLGYGVKNMIKKPYVDRLLKDIDDFVFPATPA